MSRSSRGGDSKRYFDWLYHSHQDNLAAKLLSDDVRCYNAVAFHCQQCIEKALKAYLLYKTRRLYDGHNLTWLCRQAANIDTHFMRWLSKCSNLNRYYIETRYPADEPMDIDTATVTELRDATEDMLTFICEQIRFDYRSYHKRNGG